jgi:hypothetical protein
VATGLVGSDGDVFVVLPHGDLQTSTSPLHTSGVFAPEGKALFNASGQPYPEGPFGGLYGYFQAGLPFYIGDGGTWTAGPDADGLELMLDVNMSQTSLAGATGRYRVQVVQIPAAAIPREVAPALR